MEEEESDLFKLKDRFIKEDSKIFPYSRGILFDKVIEILKKNKWRIYEQFKEKGSIELRTGWSTYSYGESILITFEKISRKKTNVHILSRGAGGTLIGFIKDHQNVKKIIKELDEELET